MNHLFFLLGGAGVALGASLGSFLAAWRDRTQRGLRCDDPPRSECPGCGKTLRWWENIPLASYLALRGRCKRCGWKIPFWYFAYELAGGAVGLLIGLLLWGRIDLLNF